MTPFFNLPMGPSGHSVRHGKTRSPKADLTTLLKMRRATQVHHEHARLSDRANVSHVRLSVRQQNFDFREGGVGRLSAARMARSNLAGAGHPTKMSRRLGQASRGRRALSTEHHRMSLWRVSRGPLRGPGPCKVHPPAPFSRSPVRGLSRSPQPLQ